MDKVNSLIDKAMAMEECPKDVVNSYEHIWGYFKNKAQIKEKENFFQKLEDYKKQKTKKEEVLYYLSQLLEKYPNNYLEESTIFTNFVK